MNESKCVDSVTFFHKLITNLTVRLCIFLIYCAIRWNEMVYITFNCLYPITERVWSNQRESWQFSGEALSYTYFTNHGAKFNRKCYKLK